MAVENLLIDGERVPAAEGRTFETVNPASGEVFRIVAGRRATPARCGRETERGSFASHAPCAPLRSEPTRTAPFPQAPFGGYKASGIGKKLGMDGLVHNTELKSVFISTEG